MPAMYGTFGRAPVAQADYDAKVKELKSQMQVLNKHLDGKFYLDKYQNEFDRLWTQFLNN